MRSADTPARLLDPTHPTDEPAPVALDRVIFRPPSDPGSAGRGTNLGIQLIRQTPSPLTCPYCSWSYSPFASNGTADVRVPRDAPGSAQSDCIARARAISSGSAGATPSTSAWAASDSKASFT